MCPAPRTITHEPTKLYFSAKEAMKMLDCPRHWLGYWTAQMGFETRPNGVHHRYTVKEINALMEIRKMKK